MFFYKYVKQTLQTRTASRSIQIQVTGQNSPNNAPDTCLDAELYWGTTQVRRTSM